MIEDAPLEMIKKESYEDQGIVYPQTNDQTSRLTGTLFRDFINSSIIMNKNDYTVDEKTGIVSRNDFQGLPG